MYLPNNYYVNNNAINDRNNKMNNKIYDNIINDKMNDRMNDRINDSRINRNILNNNLDNLNNFNNLNKPNLNNLNNFNNLNNPNNLNNHKDFKDFNKFSEITPNIYVCGLSQLNNENIIDHNIKYIICCTEVFDNIRLIQENLLLSCPNLIGILHIPLVDSNEQNLWETNNRKIKYIKLSDTIDDFDNRNIDIINYYYGIPLIEIANDFMQKIIDPVDPKNKILVHCYAGMSRSISIVLFYLMSRYKIPFNEALVAVKMKRNIAKPNDSFKTQLIYWEDNRYNR